MFFKGEGTGRRTTFAHLFQDAEPFCLDWCFQNNRDTSVIDLSDTPYKLSHWK